VSQAVTAQPSATIQTASIWWRTRATILDLIIIALLQGLINMTFGSERITNAVLDPSTTGGFSSYTSTTAVDGFWLWVVAIGYYVLLEGLFGQTVGKAAVGIRVTGLDGHRAAAQQILVRNVLRVIDWFPGFYFLGARGGAGLGGPPANRRPPGTDARGAGGRRRGPLANGRAAAATKVDRCGPGCGSSGCLRRLLLLRAASDRLS